MGKILKFFSGLVDSYIQRMLLPVNQKLKYLKNLLNGSDNFTGCPHKNFDKQCTWLIKIPEAQLTINIFIFWPDIENNSDLIVAGWERGKEEGKERRKGRR